MNGPASITGRLTLTLAAVTTTVLLLAGLAILAFQQSELQRHQERDLLSRADMVASLILRSDRAARFEGAKEKIQSFTPADGGLRFQVRGPQPYAYGVDWPPGSVRRPYRDDVYRIEVDHRTFMATDIFIPKNGDRPDVTLTAAVDLAPLRSTLLMLAWCVFAVTLIGVLAAVLLTRAVVGRGLKPVERLSQHAAALNPADHSLRLPQDALPRELEGLASAFNGGLARLEASYVGLESFNADVAHELRTPLANLIGQTQVALSRRRTSSELEEVLQSNLEDLERLGGIINDMLFLARADQGAAARNLETRSLADLVRKTADFMDPLLDEASLALEVQGDALAAIEPSLLGRAIANLIDNALRHGDKPGVIRVTIERQGGEACLAVRNRGGPIAPHHLDRLFDRFYRPDLARANSEGSHGLGLAIVKAVAIMHGGRVFARCEEGDVLVGFIIDAGRPSADRSAHRDPLVAE